MTQLEMSPWKAEDEKLIKVTPRFKKDREFKFFVKWGNFPQTLINTLLARGNWTEISEE